LWVSNSPNPGYVTPIRYRHTVGAIQGISSLLGVFVYIAIAMSLVAGNSWHLQYRWGPSSVSTLKFAVLLVIAATSGRYAIRSFSGVSQYSDRIDRWLALISFGVLASLISLACTLMYVHSFSVYPFIPSSFGGGRPERVVFLVESGTKQTAPVIIDSSGTRSVPYNLVLTTDSSYVVESPANNEIAIEFKQDAVRGMIVLR
jgi:hypothetical protein